MQAREILIQIILGIGKETAAELARRGAHVYMACRDMERCEAARAEIVLESKNKYVYCRECDLASFESIRKFVDRYVVLSLHRLRWLIVSSPTGSKRSVRSCMFW